MFKGVSLHHVSWYIHWFFSVFLSFLTNLRGILISGYIMYPLLFFKSVFVMLCQHLGLHFLPIFDHISSIFYHIISLWWPIGVLECFRLLRLVYTSVQVIVNQSLGNIDIIYYYVMWTDNGSMSPEANTQMQDGKYRKIKILQGCVFKLSLQSVNSVIQSSSFAGQAICNLPYFYHSSPRLLYCHMGFNLPIRVFKNRYFSYR